MSFGHGPVLLSLTSWTESRLTALLKANKENFDAAFDALLSENAQITVNGGKLSRAEYKNRLQEHNFGETSVTVTYNGAVEVPANKGKPVEAGSVGVFLNATIDERLIVHDSPVRRKLSSSFNLLIEQDSSVAEHVQPYNDKRRVQILDQVVVEQAVPIHISPSMGSGSA